MDYMQLSTGSKLISDISKQLQHNIAAYIKVLYLRYMLVRRNTKHFLSNTLTFFLSRRVRFVSDVDDHEPDADAGHGHEQTYQTLFQGAHPPGPMMTLLQIRLHPHSKRRCSKLCLIQRSTTLLSTGGGGGPGSELNFDSKP